MKLPFLIIVALVYITLCTAATYEESGEVGPPGGDYNVKDPRLSWEGIWAFIKAAVDWVQSGIQIIADLLASGVIPPALAITDHQCKLRHAKKAQEEAIAMLDTLKPTFESDDNEDENNDDDEMDGRTRSQNNRKGTADDALKYARKGLAECQKVLNARVMDACDDSGCDRPPPSNYKRVTERAMQKINNAIKYLTDHIG